MNIRRENDPHVIRLDNVLFAGGQQGAIYGLPDLDTVAKVLFAKSSKTEARLEVSATLMIS